METIRKIMRKIYFFIRAVWLLIRIVGTDFSGVKIDIQTAWEVSRGIWR